MFEWLTPESRQFLSRGYLVDGETAEERIAHITKAAGKILNIAGFEEKFYEYMGKGYYSLSTPIWTNFGNERGLPISCFGSYIDDTTESILTTQAEVGMMTKHGGGTSAYFGALRPRGAPITNNGNSSGAVHFMQLFETTMGVISQGSARRGNFAAYLPIEHPDASEFLNTRSEGNPLQDISFGITVTDAFLHAMIAGDQEKRTLWAKVLDARFRTGYPYIIFIDNVNNQAPEFYKGFINSSNLCAEIALPSNEEESFVCDLSSMNLAKYDEWKYTDAVVILTWFLDAVMTEFIEKAHKLPYMERAVRFARRHRAIGIGAVGYHTYLQSKMIPFESVVSRSLNKQIFKKIQEDSYIASEILASKFGPSVVDGVKRNTTTMAVAPTKSSAFILGQISEGIEPQASNYYIKDLQKGKYTVRNPHLVETLAKHHMNTEAVWESILNNEGSVQHLDLDDYEKTVYKTFSEISPMEIITQAADRQKFIDQSQSLNLMIDPDRTSTKDMNALILEAWRLGVKSLYYQIGFNAAKSYTQNADILTCAVCEA